ncbi:hypothetical protein GCM10010503_02620 [Streptomyces lucensis JCM 4490]|uniref:Uncharacterized protein n=1 Tax=Streptomyces lucensis JCM 4490 TaxID=1306176 RepID=A0A918MKE6_9ACTN|nr:hypothetical protein GCM10010503_02620 [Streptomyces lucensis JCM 4490]
MTRTRGNRPRVQTRGTGRVPVYSGRSSSRSRSKAGSPDRTALGAPPPPGTITAASGASSAARAPDAPATVSTAASATAPAVHPRPPREARPPIGSPSGVPPLSHPAEPIAPHPFPTRSGSPPGT